MINVTKPFLPPQEEYIDFLDGIWSRNWLTNNGPLVRELELKLKEYLGVPEMLYLNNGTIAIQIAIKALSLKGEIITTPFSYVATTSSIVWEGCRPVFVDIDANTFNIDPAKIEAAITPETTGILATHVFGNPCDIDAIQEIAIKHNLKVIYDAAHCFGTGYKGRSIYHYGDISTTSFHATKLFHTIEGGGVFTSNLELLKRMSYYRNFGHKTPEEFEMIGINAKNSEFHAAMGLSVLPHMPSILERRKNISKLYSSLLEQNGIRTQEITSNSTYNYSYYPIVLDSQEVMISILDALNKKDVFPRRYFFPSLDTLNYVEEQHCPISGDLSSRIICLPLFYDLKESDAEYIAKIINEIVKTH
jgi:dTDP-4-amino-4,6-dideoxygalactose transaminase